MERDAGSFSFVIRCAPPIRAYIGLDFGSAVQSTKVMNNWPLYISILALVVASIGPVVAFQQYLLAQAKFKMDLFDKRFAVYKAVQTFLNAIQRSDQTGVDYLHQFQRDTQEAGFLFKKDIVGFLESLNRKAWDASTARLEFERLPTGSEREAVCKKEGELRRDLLGELPKLKDHFGPYLSFEKWR
jgi:hypothetical protein